MKVICKRSNRLIMMQLGAMAVACCTLSLLAVTTHVDALLRTVGVTLLIMAALIVGTLIPHRRPPLLIHDDDIIEALCYRVTQNGVLLWPRRISFPSRDALKVWIGQPRQYPSECLMNTFASKSYSSSTVLLLWKRGDGAAYLVRDAQLLCNVDVVVKYLGEIGVPVTQAG